MISSWIYFLILQAVIFATFYFARNSKTEFSLSKLFPSKIHFLVVHICIFLFCYLFNLERQLFCIPVPWATIVIILFSISFLIFPFINKQSRFLNIITPFCGVGFFIAVYILLFARSEYIIFVIFNIPIILILHLLIKFVKKRSRTNVFDAFYFYPAIVLTPFLLLYQLWILLKSLQTDTQKILFVGTPILTLLIGLILTIQINNITKQISTATDKEKELKEIVLNPINNYLTELILGAHWKYHTELCLYDGWRPPFHDPILVVANKVLYPFSPFYQGIDYADAIRLYKIIYPNKPTEFDCKCAANERLIDSE